MNPANPDALADALARELARLDGWQDPDALWTDNLGIIARGGEGSPVYLDYVEDAGKLIAGPLAPLLAYLQRVTAERDDARKEASDLQNDWADQVAASRQEIERADIAEASLVTAEARAAQLQAEVEAERQRANEAVIRAGAMEQERNHLRHHYDAAMVAATNDDLPADVKMTLAERVTRYRERWQAAQARAEAAEKQAKDEKRSADMYANAWVRELGGKLFRKAHHIDACVVTTRWMRERSDRLAVIEAEQKAAALVSEYGPSNEMVAARTALAARAATAREGRTRQSAADQAAGIMHAISKCGPISLSNDRWCLGHELITAALIAQVECEASHD